MNHTTTTHARWRVLPVHLAAKLFGVLIKVEGLPFGSNRIYRASPEGAANTGSGSAGFSFGNTVETQIDAAACISAGSAHRLAQMANAAASLPIDKSNITSTSHHNNMASLGGAQLRGEDPNQGAMASILTQIIVDASLRYTGDSEARAIAAVKAFKAGMQKFNEPNPASESLPQAPKSV